jgi:hypothetical protein
MIRNFLISKPMKQFVFLILVSLPFLLITKSEVNIQSVIPGTTETICSKTISAGDEVQNSNEYSLKEKQEAPAANAQTSLDFSGKFVSKVSFIL